jgi:hypothetical protein
LHIRRSSSDVRIGFGRALSLVPPLADGRHVTGMLVVVRERPIDIGHIHVETVRDGLRFETAAFDEFVNPVDAETGAVDTGIPSEYVRRRHDTRALLSHLDVR